MKTLYFGWEIYGNRVYLGFVAEKHGVTMRAASYDAILEMIRFKEGVKTS